VQEAQQAAQALAFDLAAPFLDGTSAWNLSQVSTAANLAVKAGTMDPLLRRLHAAEAECDTWSRKADKARADQDWAAEDHARQMLQGKKLERNQAASLVRHRAHAEQQMRSFVEDVQNKFSAEPMRYAADAGRLLGRLGRLADAERVLRWGIAINADNEHAAEQCHLALGEVLLRMGRYADAVAEVEDLSTSRANWICGAAAAFAGEIPPQPLHANDHIGHFKAAACGRNVAGAINAIVQLCNPTPENFDFKNFDFNYLLELVTSAWATPIRDEQRWGEFLEPFAMSPRQLAAIEFRIPAEIPPAGGSRLDQWRESNRDLSSVTQFLDPASAFALGRTSHANHQAVMSYSPDPLVRDATKAKQAYDQVRAQLSPEQRWEEYDDTTDDDEMDDVVDDDLSDHDVPDDERSARPGRKEAMELDRARADLHYRVFAEVALMGKAREVQRDFDRVPQHYAADFGLLLRQAGRREDAERVLLWGIAANRDDPARAEACRNALAGPPPTAMQASGQFRRFLRHASEGDATLAIRAFRKQWEKQWDGFEPSQHRLLDYLALFNSQAVAPISDKPQWREFLERFYMRPQQLATLPLRVPDWVTPEGNLPDDEGEVEPDPRLGQVD
jgi:tetratricopeptide (TPR) repeat protein